MGGLNGVALVLAVGVATLCISWPDRAGAEGALAVGATGSVAKDGYSIGISTNYATVDEAKSNALDWCHTHGSKPTESHCEIITTFHHQCAAEANDPKPGTPGAGWAVAQDEETAKKMALTNCRATAGGGRRDFCKVVNVHCDIKP